jgi:hypothetical protein
MWCRFPEPTAGLIVEREGCGHESGLRTFEGSISVNPPPLPPESGAQTFLCGKLRVEAAVPIVRQ